MDGVLGLSAVGGGFLYPVVLQAGGQVDIGGRCVLGPALLLNMPPMFPQDFEVIQGSSVPRVKDAVSGHFP